MECTVGAVGGMTVVCVCVCGRGGPAFSLILLRISIPLQIGLGLLSVDLLAVLRTAAERRRIGFIALGGTVGIQDIPCKW